MTAAAVREALDYLMVFGPNKSARDTIDAHITALTADLAEVRATLATVRDICAEWKAKHDRLAALAGAAPVAWIEAEPGTQAGELASGAWMCRSTLMHMGGLTPTKRKPENELFPLFLAHAPAKAREDDGMDERDAAELLRLRYAMGERLKLAEAIELLRAAVSPSGADFCMCPALERRIEAALATFAEGAGHD